MNTFQRISITFLIITLNLSILNCQEVVEVLYKPLDNKFRELADTLVKIDQTSNQQSIDLALQALDKFEDPYIRYDLLFWELSFHYANSKQYDKCLEVLKKGHDESLYYFISDNDNPFPPYLPELKKQEGYQLFIERNNTLKNNVNKKTEYMVRLPDNYNDNKKYGLLVIMHWGIGSIRDLQYYYNSPLLQKEFIVAYFQGSVNQGSYTRSFSWDYWEGRLKKGYEQIVQKYSVDTNKIILGGPSMGGYRSLVLGLNSTVPAKGLLLSFTVVPNGLDSTVYVNAAKKGLKMAMLNGEYDWAIKQQKELGYILDKYGIANRFIVFPDMGHEFPDNWPYYLDSSIEYLMKED